MGVIACGTCVEVSLPTPPIVDVTLPTVDVAATFPMTGPPGPPGPENTTALTDHITSTRPHEAAESGKDFAAWYTALTT